MKIALIGSAPSSIGLAPYSDPSWEIWGCSPGAYPRVPRSEAWFEIHRWEPGVIGKAETQVPWFTPEYVQWLKQHPCVYMFCPPADMSNAKAIPQEELRTKYGDFFFTSSLAWMFAMAIEKMKNEEEREIGLWGVDMVAFDEYGYQRAGCQFFIQIAESMGIKIHLPPESDLMTPPPLYGLSEHTHRGIKYTSRRNELLQRKAQAEAAYENAKQELHFLNGALDDQTYQWNNWSHEGPVQIADFKEIFKKDES